MVLSLSSAVLGVLRHIEDMTNTKVYAGWHPYINTLPFPTSTHPPQPPQAAQGTIWGL